MTDLSPADAEALRRERASALRQVEDASKHEAAARETLLAAKTEWDTERRQLIERADAARDQIRKHFEIASRHVGQGSTWAITTQALHAIERALNGEPEPYDLQLDENQADLLADILKDAAARDTAEWNDQ